MNMHRVRKDTWIVIADSVKAIIYDVSQQPYSQQATLTHPKSRLKDSELGVDKPGHYKASNSSRGVYASKNSLHEDEHKLFAKEIVDYLQAENNFHQYQNLIICAEPHFYGLLHKAMHEKLSKKIIESVKKDYAQALSENKLDDIISKAIDAIVS